MTQKTIFTQEELKKFGIKKLGFEYVQVHNKEGVLLAHAHFTKAIDINTNTIVDRVLIKHLAGNIVRYGDNLTVDEIKRYFAQDKVSAVLEIVGNSMSKYNNPELNNKELYKGLKEKDLSQYRTNIVSTDNRGLSVYKNSGEKVFEANYVLKKERLNEALNITVPKIQMYDLVHNYPKEMEYTTPRELKKYFDKNVFPSIKEEYRGIELFIDDNKITKPNVNAILSTRGGYVYKSTENPKTNSCNIEYFEINPKAPGKLDFVEEKETGYLMEGVKKYKAIKSLRFFDKDSVNECNKRIDRVPPKLTNKPKGFDIVDNGDGTSSLVIAGTKCPPIKNSEIPLILEQLSIKVEQKEKTIKEKDALDNELSF